MPLILRIIKKIRWLPVPAWIPKGTLHADPLADLATLENKLSVWRVKDDESNLAKILVALAGNREYAVNLDYILFDECLLQQVGVSIQRSEGNTLLPEANSEHRDLVELTAQQLVKLAELAMENGEKRRASEPEVVGLLRDAVRQGNIDPNALKTTLLRDIVP